MRHGGAPAEIQSQRADKIHERFGLCGHMSAIKQDKVAVSSIEIQPAAGALGAYVSGIGLAACTAEQLHAVRAALVRYEVLFFREQHLSPAALARFAESFGPVHGHPAYPAAPGTPQVQILESTPERPSKIEKWHSDMTFLATPPMATLLCAEVIPPFGGDTMWASMSAAYDALSEAVKEMLAPLHAVHDFRRGFAESLAEPGGAERLADAVAANPPVRHPVVRTHPESGRKSLFVNELFTTRIAGLAANESQHWLNFLYQHCRSEEFTARLSWAPGTVVIWDNRSTHHKPVNDFMQYHRRMLRCTVSGDAPA